MIDGRQNPPIAVADLIPARILWPEFIERDGMIFIKDTFDSRLYESLKASFEAETQPHSLSIQTRLEKTLNARYLKEIFLAPGTFRTERLWNSWALYLHRTGRRNSTSNFQDAIWKRAS